MKMKLFERKKQSVTQEVAATGVPQFYGSPFAFTQQGGAVSRAEQQLYSALRQRVPVIDGAIGKIVRLTGGFRVVCADASAQKMLDGFLMNVNVGGNQRGIGAFIDSYTDSLLTFGTAVGEMVLSDDKRAFSLFNAPLENISLSRSRENPLDIHITALTQGGEVPVKNPERVLMSVLSPSEGEIYGNSLLRGLPFVSAILMQIFETIGTNWERVGNLRYAVTYRPGNDTLDKAYAKDRVMQIARGWKDAMKSGGEVKDFVAVGDVDIKVIGADNQVLDSEIPVRQLIEQIVAKTGLPPFMLGLNWSTSERMAQQQTDVLTTELWHYRRILSPVIMKIAGMYLRMNGFSPECTVEWDEISLLDETEQAKALYYRAQAEKYLAEANALKENR